MKNLTHIEVSQIDYGSRKNYRTHFDDVSLRELEDSIKQEGLLQPILVKPKKSGGYTLIAGERRLRAVINLDWKTIPAIEISVKKDQELQVQLIENLQRVNPSPYEEFLAFKEMLKKRSAQMIADSIGKNVAYVKSRLLIDHLNDQAQQLLHQGIIQLGHVRLLSRLQKDDQSKALRHIVKRVGDEHYTLSTAELQKFISSYIETSLEHAPWNLNNSKLHGGACTHCPKRSGYNKELFNDIQKDDICYDPQCYAAKLEEHLKAQIKTLKKKGKQIVEASSDPSNLKHNYIGELPISETETDEVAIITDGHLAGQTVYLQSTDEIEEQNSSEEEQSEDEQQEIAKRVALHLYETSEPINDIEFERLILWQLYSSMDMISQRKLAELYNWKLKRNNIEEKFDYTNTREFFEVNTRHLKPEKLKIMQQIVSIFLYSLNPRMRIESSEKLLQAI